LTPIYLVLAACIGYVFCQLCYLQRYKTARKSGWYSYLHVTSFGLGFLGVGITISRLGVAATCELVAGCAIDVDNEIIALVSDGFFGVATATAVCSFVNARIDRAESLSRAWKDDLSRMLHKAIDEYEVITVHLESGKIFEGYVLDTFEPSEENSYLTLLPTLVGHENPEDQEFVVEEFVNEEFLSDSYAEDDRARGDDEEIQAVQVTIPKAKIMFCRRG